jgi:hypothetical protein
VTVVFCDVTGSTSLGERLDPESLRKMMARYFEAMKGVLERHGATVEKFIGDAVMAVFGIPRLQEDDALRAIGAASQMREALAGLNRELERDHGTPKETCPRASAVSGCLMNARVPSSQPAHPGRSPRLAAGRGPDGDEEDLSPEIRGRLRQQALHAPVQIRNEIGSAS